MPKARVIIILVVVILGVIVSLLIIFRLNLNRVETFANFRVQAITDALPDAKPCFDKCANSADALTSAMFQLDTIMSSERKQCYYVPTRGEACQDVVNGMTLSKNSSLNQKNVQGSSSESVEMCVYEGEESCPPCPQPCVDGDPNNYCVGKLKSDRHPPGGGCIQLPGDGGGCLDESCTINYCIPDCKPFPPDNTLCDAKYARSKKTDCSPENPSMKIGDSCRIENCKPSCGYSEWSKWSTCSVNCFDGSDRGVKTRSRQVKYKPVGMKCDDLKETAECNNLPKCEKCVSVCENGDPGNACFGEKVDKKGDICTPNTGGKCVDPDCEISYCDYECEPNSKDSCRGKFVESKTRFCTSNSKNKNNKSGQTCWIQGCPCKLKCEKKSPEEQNGDEVTCDGVYVIDEKATPVEYCVKDSELNKKLNKKCKVEGCIEQKSTKPIVIPGPSACTIEDLVCVTDPSITSINYECDGIYARIPGKTCFLPPGFSKCKLDPKDCQPSCGYYQDKWTPPGPDDCTETCAVVIGDNSPTTPNSPTSPNSLTTPSLTTPNSLTTSKATTTTTYVARLLPSISPQGIDCEKDSPTKVVNCPSVPECGACTPEQMKCVALEDPASKYLCNGYLRFNESAEINQGQKCVLPSNSNCKTPSPCPEKACTYEHFPGCPVMNCTKPGQEPEVINSSLNLTSPSHYTLCAAVSNVRCVAPMCGTCEESQMLCVAKTDEYSQYLCSGYKAVREGQNCTLPAGSNDCLTQSPCPLKACTYSNFTCPVESCVMPGQPSTVVHSVNSTSPSFFAHCLATSNVTCIKDICGQCTPDQMTCGPLEDEVSRYFCKGVKKINDGQACVLPSDSNCFTISPCPESICSYPDFSCPPFCAMPGESNSKVHTIASTSPSYTKCAESNVTCILDNCRTCEPYQMECAASPGQDHSCKGTYTIKSGNRCILPVTTECTVKDCTPKECTYSVELNTGDPNDGCLSNRYIKNNAPCVEPQVIPTAKIIDPNCRVNNCTYSPVNGDPNDGCMTIQYEVSSASPCTPSMPTERIKDPRCIVNDCVLPCIGVSKENGCGGEGRYGPATTPCTPNPDGPTKGDSCQDTSCRCTYDLTQDYYSYDISGGLKYKDAFRIEMNGDSKCTGLAKFANSNISITWKDAKTVVRESDNAAGEVQYNNDKGYVINWHDGPWISSNYCKTETFDMTKVAGTYFNNINAIRELKTLPMQPCLAMLYNDTNPATIMYSSSGPSNPQPFVGFKNSNIESFASDTKAYNLVFISISPSTSKTSPTEFDIKRFSVNSGSIESIQNGTITYTYSENKGVDNTLKFQSDPEPWVKNQQYCTNLSGKYYAFSGITFINSEGNVTMNGNCTGTALIGTTPYTLTVDAESKKISANGSEPVPITKDGQYNRFNWNGGYWTNRPLCPDITSTYYSYLPNGTYVNGPLQVKMEGNANCSGKMNTSENIYWNSARDKLKFHDFDGTFNNVGKTIDWINSANEKYTWSTQPRSCTTLPNRFYAYKYHVYYSYVDVTMNGCSGEAAITVPAPEKAITVKNLSWNSDSSLNLNDIVGNYISSSQNIIWSDNSIWTTRPPDLSGHYVVMGSGITFSSEYYKINMNSPTNGTTIHGITSRPKEFPIRWTSVDDDRDSGTISYDPLTNDVTVTHSGQTKHGKLAIDDNGTPNKDLNFKLNWSHYGSLPWWNRRKIQT